MTRRAVGIAGSLIAAWLALLATTIGCVYAKHEARRTFAELRGLEEERDRLQVEWGQLRIEQSSWATHGRVEHLARDELGMVVPRANDVAVLRQ